MNVAIVGCGYVSEFYCRTIGSHPSLRLVGAYDHNHRNLEAFLNHWPVRRYDDLDAVIGDPSVELVLNLTNPRSHFSVTAKCLEGGKHVYSEKPLAMNIAQANELVRLARRKGLQLGVAPCSILSETAQTVWKALRDGAIGRVRLVYGNFDDGMIAPTLAPWTWRNKAGVHWPARDEFEVGCTFQHAGYILTWLAAFFGPAVRVTSFSACLLPDKGIPVDNMAPDFTVGCIEYSERIVARITCGLVAPRDKSLTIIGDDGIIRVANLRNDRCLPRLRRIPARGWDAFIEDRVNRLRTALKIPGHESRWYQWATLPLLRETGFRLPDKSKPVDFCRGPAEMAEAISANRCCQLSGELGAHMVELIEALQYPEKHGFMCTINSRFEPIQPLL